MAAGFSFGPSWLIFILPQIALIFDELYCIEKPSEGELMLTSPYATFIELPKVSEIILVTEFFW